MNQDAPAIPIENIYYLFCYAWDRFEEAQAVSIQGISSPDLPNLLAKVLLAGTRTLLRRGLDRGYKPHDEEIATVRGQIDLSQTVRLWSRRARRLHCHFDELSHDVLHNRVLKASLLRLAKAPSLDHKLASDLRQVALHFSEVTDIRLDRGIFARVQLHRNISGYGLLMRVAELAFDSLLPAPGGTGYQFHDVMRDERKMAAVFEAFVRNFYRTEQRTYSVEPLHIRWDAEMLADDGAGKLPNMRVDVFLRSPERKLIIDTKYYADALQTYHGASTFHSSHLYQLFAYLRNARFESEHSRCDGMLLYPEARSRPDGAYRVHGHTVKIATVNLAQPWQLIAKRLHDVIRETSYPQPNTSSGKTASQISL
jgi:5-methylcytosine-specific restriction enzyme subunit McrC